MDTVTIPREEYEALQKAVEFLSCLEACGVDNWCGYSDARQMLEEENEGSDYETITCKMCGERKDVEKGTWALEKGYCSPCYCEYQGG